MKFKTNKLSLNLVLASSLLAASIPAFAVTGVRFNRVGKTIQRIGGKGE